MNIKAIMITALTLSTISNVALAATPTYDPAVFPVTSLDSALSGMRATVEAKSGKETSNISWLLSLPLTSSEQFYGTGMEYDFKNGIRTSLVYTYALGFKTYGEKKFSFKPQEHPDTRDTMSNLKLKQAAHIMMLNGYYDFTIENMEAMQPYLGAGIGYGSHSYTLKVPESVNYGIPGPGPMLKTGKLQQSNKGAVSYAAYAGINYRIYQLNYIGLGYQYSNLGQSDLKYKSAFDLTPEGTYQGYRKYLEVKAKDSHGIMLSWSSKF